MDIIEENVLSTLFEISNEEVDDDVDELDGKDRDVELDVEKPWKDPAILFAKIKKSDDGDKCKNDISGNDLSGNSSPEPFGNLLSSDHFRALQMLAPHQLQLLLRFVSTLRDQRNTCRSQMICRFCQNNGEPEAWYSCHTLKDRRGRVLCPVLRAFHCPRCGATGDQAHTVKYCPENYYDGTAY